MASYLVFGDHNATQSTYNLSCKRQSIPGCPINDMSLRKMVKFCNEKADILFWCNSYPLMGSEAFINNPRYLSLRLESRWIPYHKFPQKRGFFRRNFWKELEEEELDLFFTNYLDMTRYIYDNLSDKLILLPISCYLYDRTLNLKSKALSYLKLFPFKMVDLSLLDTISNEEAFTKQNALTKSAWQLIKPKLMEWVN